MTKITNLTPIIELKSLTKGFDGENIISQFNLTINNGQFLTILGPSGCGKTTILRLIAGLEQVDNGSIILEGQDITNVPAEQRHINTVFQNYALFPHMSVFDNVSFGLRIQKKSNKEIKSKVEKILCMVQLENFTKRYPYQLSGGQQQRVAIARAIINKPKVLLLDESLSALDYNLRKKMQNELKHLQRQLGITFIYVTHDQDEALAMSDRILVMKEGHIEQDASPREIYEKPKNLFVAQFIGKINVFNAITLYRIDENRIRANVEGYECNIYTKISVIKGQQLKVLLRPEDMRVKEIYNDQQPTGLVGYVYERSYKGMMLDIEVKINNGKRIMITEFFNEDDPDIDHLLEQKISVTWVESWETVFLDE
ncbi:MAG: spermidine/putrescine ABC transporter ATP-binding protein PotA [Arsenophonus endosymbiont of Ceratovacuna japonica]